MNFNVFEDGDFNNLKVSGSTELSSLAVSPGPVILPRAFGKLVITFEYIQNDSVTIETLESTSLTELLSMFNNKLQDSNILYIGLLEIIFTSGQNWVVEPDNRTLLGPGCVYSNSPYTLEIGRKETKIQSIRITGFGQGTSVIRGSCILNIWNLQEIGLIDGNNINKFKGSDQYDLRLLLQNFLWIGWIAVNLKYSEPIQGMTTPSVTGSDILNPEKNKYIIKGNVTSDTIINWRSDKRVEILLMNVWIQMSEPPVNNSTQAKFKPIITPVISVPLFFLNTPSLYRIFMSSCNFISYTSLKPPEGETMPPPLALLSSEFLNHDAVTDTFLQMCSFSTREFGAPFPEARSLQLVGNDKVSISDCQFSGRVVAECNKIAALGCYFLGTGIFPGEEQTTHALVHIPPKWFYDNSALVFGLPSGPRLIINTCQFVTHTKEIFSYEQIQSDLSRLPFSYANWSDPEVVTTMNNLGYSQLNIIFNSSVFYMVAAKDITDYSKGFDFSAVELTNLPTPVTINTGNSTLVL